MHRRAKRSKLDLNRLRRTRGLGPRRLNLITRQRHTHAPLTADFWLAEQAQGGIWLSRAAAKLPKLTCCDSPSTKTTADADGQTGESQDWQAESPRMQSELGQVLRNQRNQTGVVRARRDFAEPHLITFDEQFNTEQPPTTQ